MSVTTSILEVEHVSREFGDVTVLEDVSFAVSPGTVTGLVGENGAGKSTLIRILAGALPATTGSVMLAGRELPDSTNGVIAAGLSVIYQELTDIPDMSLLENVLLGNLSQRAGVTAPGANRKRARQGLDMVGLGGIDLATPIRNLTMAQRQLAEIARCLVRDARVLILDEPTSALPERDVELLLGVVEQLRAEGIAIIYVSHHLDELFRVADRVIVLRDGRLVADAPTPEWTEAALVRAMLAKDLEQAYPWRPREHGDNILRVEQLEAPGVRGAHLHVSAGEVVGLVGLAGAGRTELMKTISGATKRTAGRVYVSGHEPRPGSVRDAKRAGIVYAPEDRKQEGLVLDASIQSNLIYGSYRDVSRLGTLRPGRIAQRAAEALKTFAVRARSGRQPVGELSGGNQQKVVVARIARNAPRVAIFDDPTRGVDVGAKSGIYDHIFGLAESGSGILVSSSDTDEVLAVSDRAYVLRAGRIVAEITRDQFDREHILHLTSGTSITNGADLGTH